MPDPAQPSADPKPADPSNNGGGQPDPKPAATPAANEPDLSKLSADQLTKVLENPELWNLPRIKELREAQTNLKKLQDQQSKDADKKLEEDKKFEELATKKQQENEALQEQLKTQTINQALTNKLVAESVVDLDGALKLVDRAKVSVDDNGNVQGIDEALTALKTDKSYLFKPGSTTPSVGTPTNPGNGNQPPTGPAKYKRSQITPEFYKANADEINKAAAAGLIEDDGPAQY